MIDGIDIRKPSDMGIPVRPYLRYVWRLEYLSGASAAFVPQFVGFS